MASTKKFREAAVDLVQWMEGTERGEKPRRAELDPRLLALGALVGAGLGTIVIVASAGLT